MWDCININVLLDMISTIHLRVMFSWVRFPSWTGSSGIHPLHAGSRELWDLAHAISTPACHSRLYTVTDMFRYFRSFLWSTVCVWSHLNLDWNYLPGTAPNVVVTFFPKYMLFWYLVICVTSRSPSWEYTVETVGAAERLYQGHRETWLSSTSVSSLIFV